MTIPDPKYAYLIDNKYNLIIIIQTSVTDEDKGRVLVINEDKGHHSVQELFFKCYTISFLIVSWKCLSRFVMMTPR